MSNWLGLVVVIGIFLVMAGFSCTIDIKKFFYYIKRPKGILLGLFCQYGCLPLAAFFISQMLALSSLHSIAFIITSSCPGGTLSNFWCWFFGSDLELSIAMTASSSLLSFLFLTINCLIYMPLITDTNVNIDYVSLGISVSSLIFGVAFGLGIGYKTQNNKTQTQIQTQTLNSNKRKKKKKGNQCRQILIIIGCISMILTLLLGAYQNTLVSSTPAYKLPFEIFIAGLMLNGTSWILTFVLSYFICQLPNNQSITVCIECANQNVGLAIAIILLTMDRYSADIAVGVPMFYGVLNASTIFIIGSILRLCGFIENLDDDFNHKYQNSGFTKLCLFVNKHTHDMDTIVTHDIDDDALDEDDMCVGGVRGSEVGGSSSMIDIQLKSSSHTHTHTTMTTTLEDYDDDDDEYGDEGEDMEDDMLMARAQTPSNEDVAVQQSFKNINLLKIKNESTYNCIKVNDTTPITDHETEQNERLHTIYMPHDI